MGAGQLLGRIGYAPLVAATSPAVRTVAIVLVSAAAMGLLGALTGPPALLVAAAVAAGAVRGIGTLLQATVVADRWGTARYATLSGFFAAPITGAAALAPWAATVLAEWTGSYPATFWLLAGLVALGAAAAVAGFRTT
jgi:hypothetical protein